MEGVFDYIKGVRLIHANGRASVDIIIISNKAIKL